MYMYMYQHTCRAVWDPFTIIGQLVIRNMYRWK